MRNEPENLDLKQGSPKFAFADQIFLFVSKSWVANLIQNYNGKFYAFFRTKTNLHI